VRNEAGTLRWESEPKAMLEKAGQGQRIEGEPTTVEYNPSTRPHRLNESKRYAELY